ncbi:transglycosylase SLT domain-containing protein [Candidatus Uhrbacteria bacterium]|nr:transglycosylase SLT domain-containing protein [Candidatus Uhrbacteria bacterium]
MDGILNWCRSVASEQRGQSVGRVLTYVLITFTIVVVVYTIFLGYGAMTIAAGDYIADTWTRGLVLFTVAVVLVATGIAIVPTLIESARKHSIWWMNLWRALAIFLFVATVWKLSPFDITRATNAILRYTEEFFGESTSPPMPLQGQPRSRVQLTPQLEQIRQKEIARMYDFYMTFPRDVAKRITAVRNWRLHVDTHAERQGVDPSRIEAIMAVESRGDAHVTSTENARGLLQLIDGTAREHGGSCGLTNPANDSYDPEKNICTGCSYFRFITEQEFRGDEETALAGYNGGPTRVNEVLDALPGSLPRSFWALHAAREPNGRPLIDRLINRKHGTREMERYVPAVLAWEAIFREYDAQQGATSTPAIAPREADSGMETDAPEGVRVILAGAVLHAHDAPRGSPVWYTAQEGDRLGGIAINVLQDARPVDLAQRNPDARSRGALPDGFRVFLPEDRYAFHHADGNQTYAEIARRYGMTTAELLRWSDGDSCAASDCDARTPPTGTRLLVRR